MKLKNKNLYIDFINLLIVNGYVHEEQLKFMKKLSKRYKFNMDSVWKKMHDNDYCSTEVHFSIAEESCYVRLSYRRDIVKLACLDGMLDLKEESIIRASTGMAREEYESKANRYLNYFRRKTRRERHAFLHPHEEKVCPLEVGSGDQYNDLQQLLGRYVNGFKSVELDCKMDIIKDVEKLFINLRSIKNHTDEITVALIGKTKVGKTTLFNAMMKSEFYPLIGEGSQGTTRIIRAGHWHGIHIIDTPGLEAMNKGGKHDEEVTKHALQYADILVAFIPNDSQEVGMEDFYLDCERTGKPVFYVQNVYRNLNKSKRILKEALLEPAKWKEAEEYDENFKKIEDYYANRGFRTSLFNRSSIVSYSKEMMSGHIENVEGENIHLNSDECEKIKQGSGFPEFEARFTKFIRENYRFACANRYYPYFFESISALNKPLENERRKLIEKGTEIHKQKEIVFACLKKEKSLCMRQFHTDMSEIRTNKYEIDSLQNLIDTKKINRKNFKDEAELICSRIQESANHIYIDNIEKSRNRLVILSDSLKLRTISGKLKNIELDEEWDDYTGEYFKLIAQKVFNFFPPGADTVFEYISKNLGGEKILRDILPQHHITFIGINQRKRDEILENFEGVVQRCFDTMNSCYSEAIEKTFSSCYEGAKSVFREREEIIRQHLSTVSYEKQRIVEVQNVAGCLRARGYLRIFFPNAQYVSYTYDKKRNVMMIHARGVSSTQLRCSGMLIEIKED